jgi:serine/threonine protein kinase/Tol biopolymer transport system component
MIDPADLRDVFDRAVSLPPQDRAAFLAHACGENAALRHEVERLLGADARAGSVFGLDSSDGGGSGAAAQASGGILPGARLGPYVVMGSLGAGGMGEVYKAHDTRLDRSVAIKVLPAALMMSTKARQRFEREARAIAALSHPHICPIFDVGREDSRDYLVMEHLRGETLAARLLRGPLPVPEALTTAIEIAGALVAAHRAGIVHRDLKPGNVMLTDAGARLLDFGLASQVDASSRDATASAVLEPITSTGAIVGTLPYMAPEQIEGGPLDARTDIFAFGSVLYEMLTGRRAFGGSTQGELVSAILRDQPPSIRTSNPALPPALDRLIGRCLAKAPYARWRSVDELQTALIAQQPRRTKWVPLVVSLLVTVMTAVVLATLLWPSAGRMPRVTAIHRVTHDSTLKETPFSDGTRVVYTTWNTGFDGNSAFQVPAAGGQPVPLKTPFKNPFLYDLLARSGEVLLSDGQGSALYAMPLIGGQARPIGNIRAGFVAASRDERRITFALEGRLMVASIDGSDVHQVTALSRGFVYMPRWSADGTRIRYTVVADGNDRSLWEVSVDGTGLRAIAPGFKACCGTWTANGRYYVFEAERDGDYGLWAIAAGAPAWWDRTPAPVKLTTGPMRYENAMESNDGRAVFALGTAPTTGELAKYDKRSGLFVPIPGALAARDVDFSRDGLSMAYVDNADGTIWRSRADGSDRRQLTFPPLSTSLPRWSPDGKRIVYCARGVEGPSRLFVIDADGGQPKEIGRPEQDYDDPTWSADGTRVAVASFPIPQSSGPSQIQIEDLKTSQTSVVPGSNGLFSSRWSPDGQSIVAIDRGSGQLMLYAFATGRWRDLIPNGHSFGWPSWTADSSFLLVQRGKEILRIRAANGQTSVIASLENVRQVMLPDGQSWIGFSPDGTPLVLRESTSPREVYSLSVDWQ